MYTSNSLAIIQSKPFSGPRKSVNTNRSGAELDIQRKYIRTQSKHRNNVKQIKYNDFLKQELYPQKYLHQLVS
jgi:hypothetical protein